MDVTFQRPGNTLRTHRPLFRRNHLEQPPAPPSTSSSTLVDDSPPLGIPPYSSSKLNSSDTDRNYSDGGQTPHPSRHPHLSYRPSNISYADMTGLTSPDVDVSTFSFGIRKNHGPGTSWLHDGKSVMSVDDHISISEASTDKTSEASPSKMTSHRQTAVSSRGNRYNSQKVNIRTERLADETMGETWLDEQTRLIAKAETTDDIDRIKGAIEGHLSPSTARKSRTTVDYPVASPSRNVGSVFNHNYQARDDEIIGSNVSDTFQFQEHSTPQLGKTLVATSTPNLKSIPGYLRGINTPAPSNTRDHQDDIDESISGIPKSRSTGLLSTSTMPMSSRTGQLRDKTYDNERDVSLAVRSRNNHRSLSSRAGLSSPEKLEEERDESNSRTPEKHSRQSLLSYSNKTPRFPGHLSMYKPRDTVSHPSADTTLEKNDSAVSSPSKIPTMLTFHASKTLSTKKPMQSSESEKEHILNSPGSLKHRSVRFQKDDAVEKNENLIPEPTIQDVSQSVCYPGTYKSRIIEDYSRDDQEDEMTKGATRLEPEPEPEPEPLESELLKSKRTLKQSIKQVDDKGTEISQVRKMPSMLSKTPNTLAREAKRREIYEKLAQANTVENTLSLKIEDLKQSVEDIGTKIGEKLSQILERNLQSESRRRFFWVLSVLVFQFVVIAAMIVFSEIRSRELFYYGYFEPFYGSNRISRHVGRDAVKSLASSGFYYNSDSYNTGYTWLDLMGGFIVTAPSRILSVLRIATGDLSSSSSILTEGSGENWIPS